jgi:hypothetical protein
MAEILPGARPPEPGRPGPTLGPPLHRRCAVLRLLGVLVLVWLVVTVVGAVVEGLFWLAVVGLVLVVVTGLVGWGKRDTRV